MIHMLSVRPIHIEGNNILSKKSAWFDFVCGRCFKPSADWFNFPRLERERERRKGEKRESEYVEILEPSPDAEILKPDQFC